MDPVDPKLIIHRLARHLYLTETAENADVAAGESLVPNHSWALSARRKRDGCG